ncbi:hypothetical protein [Chryseobacterium salviniae]|uniref:WG containing repeat-containing protein n=1 Tax=Chryseobacterium salviniae TaxID=3101750 RepID=A0ABU6HWK0_9FLAO|nr:hypothetical protein [Chryseobacterium sp. T9W2-O]MEC3876852.1 hypothetical protein [Chryseobacterium sp. T9W2-O]
MKVLFPVVLLCSGLIFSQKTVPPDYRKIPEILDNPEFLYPFIIPDKKYEYWSVLRNNPDPDKAIIYESQAPDFMTLNDPSPVKGFFQKCLGEDCFSYVLACENGRTLYFSDEQQLRNFIGFVDNLPEAVLISNTYGYIVDTGNILSSSYKIDEEHISLYLTKFTNSTSKESFLIIINRKTGKLEVKNISTY